MDYDQFIEKKVKAAQACGFEPKTPISDRLFEWQGMIVKWALRIGRAALFEDCGLGKTIQQLEWARHVCEHTGGDVLILCPLAVAQQTIREAKDKLGLTVHHARTPDQLGKGINITNYEKIDLFPAVR